MKSIKALLVVTALSISSLAMAEGGADRTFARMEQARQTSLEAYRVAQQQKVELLLFPPTHGSLCERSGFARA